MDLTNVATPNFAGITMDKSDSLASTGYRSAGQNSEFYDREATQNITTLCSAIDYAPAAMERLRQRFFNLQARQKRAVADNTTAINRLQTLRKAIVEGEERERSLAADSKRRQQEAEEKVKDAVAALNSQLEAHQAELRRLKELNTGLEASRQHALAQAEEDVASLDAKIVSTKLERDRNRTLVEKLVGRLEAAKDALAGITQTDAALAEQLRTGSEALKLCVLKRLSKPDCVEDFEAPIKQVLHLRRLTTDAAALADGDVAEQLVSELVDRLMLRGPQAGDLTPGESLLSNDRADRADRADRVDADREGHGDREGGMQRGSDGSGAACGAAGGVDERRGAARIATASPERAASPLERSTREQVITARSVAPRRAQKGAELSQLLRATTNLNSAVHEVIGLKNQITEALAGERAPAGRGEALRRTTFRRARSPGSVRGARRRPAKPRSRSLGRARRITSAFAVPGTPRRALSRPRLLSLGEGPEESLSEYTRNLDRLNKYTTEVKRLQNIMDQVLATDAFTSAEKVEKIHVLKERINKYERKAREHAAALQK